MLPHALGAPIDYYRHVIFDNSLTRRHLLLQPRPDQRPSFIEATERPPSRRRRALPHSSQCHSPSVAVRARQRMERANLYARLPQPPPRPRRPQPLLLDLRAPADRRRRPAKARPLHSPARASRLPNFPPVSALHSPWANTPATFPPLDGSKSASRSPTFNPHPSTHSAPNILQSLIFHQDRADNVRHTLIIDEIRVADAPSSHASLSAPHESSRHRLRSSHRTRMVRHRLRRALPLRHLSFSRKRPSSSPSACNSPAFHRYEDFLGKSGVHARYKVAAAGWDYRESRAIERSRRFHARTQRRRTAHHDAACLLPLLLGGRRSPLRHDPRKHSRR